MKKKFTAIPKANQQVNTRITAATNYKLIDKLVKDYEDDYVRGKALSVIWNEITKKHHDSKLARDVVAELEKTNKKVDYYDEDAKRDPNFIKDRKDMKDIKSGCGKKKIKASDEDEEFGDDDRFEIIDEWAWSEAQEGYGDESWRPAKTFKEFKRRYGMEGLKLSQADFDRYRETYQMALDELRSEDIEGSCGKKKIKASDEDEDGYDKEGYCKKCGRKLTDQGECLVCEGKVAEEDFDDEIEGCDVMSATAFDLAGVGTEAENLADDLEEWLNAFLQLPEADGYISEEDLRVLEEAHDILQFAAQAILGSRIY